MKFIPRIIILMAFGLAFIGCASNIDISQNDIIRFNVDNVSEGILLSFDHIPKEATRIIVHFHEITESDNPVTAAADIKESSLDSVKKTGKVVCPFVQNGHKYEISIYCEINGIDDTSDISKYVITTITAENVNGIYNTNDSKLLLNNTQTGVMLSSMPVFSKEIPYAPPKYSFVFAIPIEGRQPTSFYEKVDDPLKWDFRSGIINVLNESQSNLTGDFPAYIFAYCYLNYENLRWVVKYAQSDNFVITL